MSSEGKSPYEKKTYCLKTEHKNIPLMEWIEVPEPIHNETCVRFRLYHTGKNFALKTSDGYGPLSPNLRMPRGWSGRKPEYRTTEEGILNLLERRCEERGIEVTEE